MVEWQGVALVVTSSCLLLFGCVFSLWTADCSVWSCENATHQNPAGIRLPQSCASRWSPFSRSVRTAQHDLWFMHVCAGDLEASPHVLRSVACLCHQLPVLDKKLFDSHYQSVSMCVYVPKQSVRSLLLFLSKPMKSCSSHIWQPSPRELQQPVK